MKTIKTREILTGSSILGKISVLIYVLCAIIILYSSHRLYVGLLDYRKAEELQIVQEIAEPITDGLKNFMFERGRMNVVLSSEGAVTADNRSFIDDRRSAADEYFEKAFSLMDGKYQEVGLLRQEYDKIKGLRITMDIEAQKPLHERDPNATSLWYTSCSSYINLISSKLKNIENFQMTTSLISDYKMLIIDTIRFRSVVGNESSIITSAVTGRIRLTDEDYSALLHMRGESDKIWDDIVYQIEIHGSEKLLSAMNLVKNKYYVQFRPFQDEILELLLKERVYEGADKELAELSVPALDSIFNLTDEAIGEIRILNENNMHRGRWSLISGIVQLAACVVIIIFAPAYLKARLIKPLNVIVGLIEDISFGKTDAVVPYVQRKDEIGKLANGVEMLQKSVMQLEELSIKDPLTGLFNRRYTLERLNELELRYKRSKTNFALIICDIDKFKEINDTFGHGCGDTVLLGVTHLMMECCREQDILARWGGEEFLIVTPRTGRDGARSLAERIQSELNDKCFYYGDACIQVSMSFGVSEYDESLGIVESIDKADKALLSGKSNGRNKVIVF